MVLVARIKSDLTLDYRFARTNTLRMIYGEDFFRKKGIVALFDESLFTKAQTEGKVKGTLLSWFRQQEDTDFQTVFQEVQERCLLIDQKGTDENLRCNRRQLAHIVDYHILGKYDNTDLRFTEAQQRSQELEKQVRDVGKQVRGLKKDLQEKTSRFNEVGNQVTELKKELQEKASQFNEVENQVTDLKKDFQQEMSDMNELVQTLRDENRSMRERSLWATVKLLVPSLPMPTSPRLRLFLLALLVSFPLLLPLIWGGGTNKRRSMLDEGADHRRYMNNKLQEIAKRFIDIENDLAGLKMSSPGKSGKIDGDLETKPVGPDSDDAAERKEQMQEQLAELKGQVEDLKQVIGENSQAKGIILLDMLR